MTGAGIVIFLMGGFWLHPLTFYATGLLILAGSMYEYYQIVKAAGVKPQIIAGILTGAGAYTLATLIASGTLTMKYFLVIVPAMLLILVAEVYRKQEQPFHALAHTFFPVIYIVLPFLFFPFSAYMHEGISSLLPHGHLSFSPGIVLGFFILQWANDTGAYLTGISFGKHRLMERISPKKSWEGFIGGLLITAVIAFFLSIWPGVVSRQHWIILSVIISVSGTYGDLVESMLKRSLGVKDSGSVMPGHGGFLDRFDSTFISFPLVFLFILLFG